VWAITGINQQKIPLRLIFDLKLVLFVSYLLILKTLLIVLMSIRYKNINCNLKKNRLKSLLHFNEKFSHSFLLVSFELAILVVEAEYKLISFSTQNISYTILWYSFSRLILVAHHLAPHHCLPTLSYRPCLHKRMWHWLICTSRSTGQLSTHLC